MFKVPYFRYEVKRLKLLTKVVIVTIAYFVQSTCTCFSLFFPGGLTSPKQNKMEQSEGLIIVIVGPHTFMPNILQRRSSDSDECERKQKKEGEGAIIVPQS